MDQLMNSMKKNNIDIIFTDCWVGGGMMQMYSNALNNNDLQLLPGESFYTGRTTSLLINANSKRKILSLMELEFGSNMTRGPKMALDNFFNIMSKSKLNIKVCLPFLSTVNPIDSINKSDVSDGMEISKIRWEKLHIFSSQMFYIRAKELNLQKQFIDLLADLDLEQLKSAYSYLLPCLIKSNYIKKARKKINT